MRAWYVAAFLALAACDHWPGVSSSNDGGLTTGGGSSRFDDASGDLGSSCGANVSCNVGLTCYASYPNGFCTKTCQSSADCGGGLCVLDFNAGLICLKACTSDITCRDGYSCQAPDGVNEVCAPGGAPVDAGVDFD